MPSNNDDWQSYAADPRTVCKYGAKCYQKSSQHHENYKHPPQKLTAAKNFKDRKRFSPYTKKNKTFNDSEKDSSNSANTSKEEPTITKNTTDDIVVKPNIPDNVKYYDINDEDKVKLLKEKFLVEMPDDFYKFYEFLLEEGNPEKVLDPVNIELVGPYDLLLGKLPIVEDSDLYLVHLRYFYDPPEFQTVLRKKGKGQYHIGYYRDDPTEKPVFLASNDSEKDHKIVPIADNIFAAVYYFLQDQKKISPFIAMTCQKLMDKIKDAATKYSYSIQEYNIKKRYAKSVTKTFHGAGIVVPYNKNTQLGYRRLTETDAKLKTLFTKLQNAATQDEKEKVLSELQPSITYANIAVDECDFGTGLEMGIDLFCSGLKELESSALSFLVSAYGLLNRDAFSKIIQVHMKYRRKGSNLSVLDFS